MKRFFDIILSTLALTVLWLPMLFLGILVKLTSDGPVLYWSTRVGKDKRVFRMPKFRTMRMGSPEVATILLENPERFLTPVGACLRRSSLDELPQLWSILKGDMSFVGPRPVITSEYDLLALRAQHGVTALRPGLTGWAQINGRNNLSIPQKVALEVEYLNRQSFLFDLKILAMTFWEVMSGSGEKKVEG